MSDTTTEPIPPEPGNNNYESLARYTRELLDEIRAMLVSYTEEKGAVLIPNGTSYTGYCPIHNDTRPSFSIYGDGNQRWKCFACDLGGDIFDLCQALGLAKNFRDAVPEVARSLGIPLPTLGRSNSESGATQAPVIKRVREPQPPVPLSEEEDAYRLLARITLRDAIRE
ncbi:MAG: hypothetical protein EOP83_19275, partial [Verrucomicrobiaceae bacterium]